MLDSGGNTILLPPFGSLSGEVPPVLPIPRLRFEQLVVVRVYDKRISDGIGRDGDGDRCVGDGGHHHLSYGPHEAPEDIGSNGLRRCVFVSVAFISSQPHCHCLLVRNMDGSDKIGQLSRN